MVASMKTLPPRSSVLFVRLKPAEKVAVEKAAKKTGLSEAEITRRALVIYLARDGQFGATGDAKVVRT